MYCILRKRDIDNCNSLDCEYLPVCFYDVVLDISDVESVNESLLQNFLEDIKYEEEFDYTDEEGE